MKLQLTLVLITSLSCIPARAQDAQPLTVSSPLEYQVFQRSTRLHGAILVRGNALTATRVDARVEGTSLKGPLPGRWQHLALDRADHEFSGELPVIAGGFYSVEIKATNSVGPQTSVIVRNVGVGEVFVISGQSNSTNYGEVTQTTQTGMVTSFSGTEWSLANDPQPGVQDNSRKGSFIPSFGDALYRRYLSQHDGDPLPCIPQASRVGLPVVHRAGHLSHARRSRVPADSRSAAKSLAA